MLLPVLDGNAEVVFRISSLLPYMICLFLKGSKGTYHFVARRPK